MIDSHKTNETMLGAGGVDWLAHWRQMVETEKEQSLAIATAERAQSGDRWSGQADRYVKATGRAPQPDAFMSHVLPHLTPTDTVLDIGAGAGRHTLFLASRVAHVIAVERSPAMRNHLLQRIEAQQLTNVTVIADDWPLRDAPLADVSICSHVVYGVHEIGPFLHQINDHTRRICFLAAGFHQPSYVMSPFWEQIHGMRRLPLPGAIECINVLAQLGIPANLTLIPTTPYTFSDEDEALADIRWRLHLPPTPANDAAIRQAMADILVYDDTGRLTLPNQLQHSAIVWWARS